MIYEKDGALFEVLLNWIEQTNATIAFTGSVRQCRMDLSGAKHWATLNDLSKSITFCMERASRDLWGRGEVRKGASLDYAGAMEGGGDSGTRLHAHLVIGGVPQGVSFNRVEDVLTHRWRTSRWGYFDVDVQRLASADDVRRWARYVLKDITPASFDRWVTNVTCIPF